MASEPAHNSPAADNNATAENSPAPENNPAPENSQGRENTATSGLVLVGHWSDAVAETGCTVIVLPTDTIASYEVRGGAPASRELVLLEPEKSVTTIDAICLTGGSVFGLAAADGAVQYLVEQGRGVLTPGGVVPIVPTMALFDLAVDDGSVRPTATNGYDATRAASAEFAIGRVGAGTGAYVAKWRQEQARPGGLAFATEQQGELIVEAIVACNAFGDISAEVTTEAVAATGPGFDFDRQNTTIGLVVTNARLDKVGCRIIAQGAHDGLARTITPPHTRFDGDGFVAAATQQVTAPIDLVRMMALAAVTRAIRSLA